MKQALYLTEIGRNAAAMCQLGPLLPSKFLGEIKASASLMTLHNAVESLKIQYARRFAGRLKDFEAKAIAGLMITCVQE
jgi:hypothetical protein